MMSSLNPGIILIIAGVLSPLLPRAIRGWVLLTVPVFSFLYMLSLNVGDSVTIKTLGYTLELLRVDKLSMVWGYIFHLAAFLGMLYALHVKDPMQQVSALIYAGAAIGAVFAGDLITLFVYWELTGQVCAISLSRSAQA
jgi:multicomponent Na+:H+ antiporter subunit D